MIPSLPDYGFSSRPTEVGWGVERIGRAWDVLMKRLGYTRYLAQGGDWGAGVVEAMGRQAPEGLLGIHTNLPAVFPPDAAAAIASGGPAPAGLSEQEQAAFDGVRRFLQNGGRGYYPRRPRGLDARARRVRALDVRQGPHQSPTKDEVLDNFSLHWLTNTVTSGGEVLLGEPRPNLISAAAQKTSEITLPVAITVVPNDDLFRAPETWARRAFPNLIYFHQADRGGHFAAWEEPQLFSDEVRAAFRSLR